MYSVDIIKAVYCLDIWMTFSHPEVFTYLNVVESLKNSLLLVLPLSFYRRVGDSSLLNRRNDKRTKVTSTASATAAGTIKPN